MLIHIKSIPIKRWHGKEGAQDFGEPTTLEVLVDSGGRYATGINKEDRLRLEEATGFRLDSKFDPENPHPFWSRPQGRIKLPRRTLILDTKKPLDEIKYLNVKASKFVANSLEDYDNGLYPDATHYIHNDNEQVIKKGKSVAFKMEAYGQLKTMGPKRMDAVAWVVLGLDLSNQSIEYKTAKLGEAIETDAIAFTKAAGLDKEHLVTMELILASVYYGLLKKEGEAYYHFTTKIGIDITAAVNYLTSPANQDLKIRLMQQLEAKRNML